MPIDIVNPIAFLMAAAVVPAGPETAAETEHRLDQEGKPCDRSSNCVSSITPAGKPAIAPLTYACTPQLAQAALANILRNDAQVRKVIERPDYLRAEYVSRIFGFVDDVEFFFNSDGSRIQVRSSSRSGFYDFGANRRRLERIRRQLRERTDPHPGAGR